MIISFIQVDTISWCGFIQAAWPPKKGSMDSDIEVPASEQAQSFFVRMLVKTALKSIIWCAVAAVIVYFSPESTWVWYLVLAFVGIGLAVALLSKGAAIHARRREAAQDDDASVSSD